MRKFNFILIVVFTLLSCATKRKIKVVERTNQNLERVVENDSNINFQLKRNSYDFLSKYSKQESLISKLGLTYTGKTKDDKAKVSLKQTKDGLELDIQGAIAMDLEKEQSKNENISVQKVISLVDSAYSVRLQQDLAQREKRLLDSFKSDTEKQKFDFSFWIYFIIGGIFCIGLAFYKIKK